MKAFFEQIAKDNGWYFSYGKNEFHNLDETEKPFSLYLDAVEEDIVHSEFNNITGHFFKSRIMLLKKSDLDEVYDSQCDNDPAKGRYEAHIKPCKQQAEQFIDALTCEGYSIKKWQITEVINAWDENCDGIIIYFSVEKL
ncbi:hypothetical protein ACF3OB_01160 [Capnocytophaga canis]|uniref:hypothetical protein n=1 Tax=Capnocytophaga canis TaxID=1848903 RepID=UPI001AC7A846|nr:hypothetical protein [Capnocytophaga canis]GIM60538.1 hypothetical protein CAPN008_05880 [Capnocytophaga canis]